MSAERKLVKDYNNSKWDRFNDKTIEEAYGIWVNGSKLFGPAERSYWRAFFRKHIWGLE